MEENIELYRREELLELQPSDWKMALLIFKEMGWTPKRSLEAYATPLAFVPPYEAEGIRHAGQKLFAIINDEPLVFTSIQMDLGLLHRISEFVGGGAFIVGKKGSYAKAKSDADF